MPLGSIEILPLVPVVIVIPPLPEVRLIAVAPVALPIVIVLAAAPVPTLMFCAIASLPILMAPVPLAFKFKSTSVSSPEAEIVGPFPVAALVTVISLTALAVVVPLTNSFPFESKMFPMRFPLKVVAVTDPVPEISLAPIVISPVIVPPASASFSASNSASAV